MSEERSDYGHHNPARSPSCDTPAKPHSENGTLAELQAECERLRQRLTEVDAERQRDRECVATLQNERDACRRALHACARMLFTEDELRTIPAVGECVPLEQFIGELEQIVHHEP